MSSLWENTVWRCEMDAEQTVPCVGLTCGLYKAATVCRYAVPANRTSKLIPPVEQHRRAGGQRVNR